MKLNNKPFMSIEEAAETTGLSTFYLRNGCKAGSVPHVKSGKKYLVNVSALLQKLGVPIGGEADGCKTSV